MSDDTLFPMPEQELEVACAPGPKAPPRVQRADRAQIQLRPVSLEALVPEDHQVRAVWAYVQHLDLSSIYGKLEAVEGKPGRPAIDPRILLALWLNATLDGVGSARAIERLCRDHTVYMWICGGVGVNHHALSDFRTQHEAEFNQLLTDSVALLRNEGLVEMMRVAQDGVRVRASAGAASFRREQSLEEHLKEAKAQVERLREELDEDPAAASTREKAARQRALEDREKRVAEAIRQLPEVRAKKPARERGEARVSTTDPDARVMKMADGGFRPAYNAQLATDAATQVIVGVDVSNVGSDMGQLRPMVEQVVERHHTTPKEVLVDGGFVKLDDIESVSAAPFECTVYAPVQKPRDGTRDPHVPLPEDSATIAAWRQRMGMEEAKEIYKERAATAECVNANLRNHGLRGFLVRGLRKVRAVVLLFALAHNLMRTMAICPAICAVAQMG